MKPRTVVIALAAVAGLAAMMTYGTMRRNRASDPGEIQVDEHAEQVTEQMLRAFSEDDYDGFAAEFADRQKARMDEAEFEEWRADLFTEVGGFDHLVDASEPTHPKPDRTKYVFDAAFDEDPEVRFTIVFEDATDLVLRFEMASAG